MQATLFLKHMSNSVHVQTIRYLVQSQTDTSFSKEKPNRVFVDCPERGRLWVVSVQIVSTSSIDDALAHRDVARWIVDESGAIRLEDRSSATRWVVLDFVLIGSRRYHLPRLGYAACKILVCTQDRQSNVLTGSGSPERHQETAGELCACRRAASSFRLLFEKFVAWAPTRGTIVGTTANSQVSSGTAVGRRVCTKVIFIRVRRRRVRMSNDERKRPSKVVPCFQRLKNTKIIFSKPFLPVTRNT